MLDCGVERRAWGGKGAERVEQLPESLRGAGAGECGCGSMERVYGAEPGLAGAWPGDRTLCRNPWDTLSQRSPPSQQGFGHLATVGQVVGAQVGSLVGFLPTLFRIWPLAAA